MRQPILADPFEHEMAKFFANKLEMMDDDAALLVKHSALMSINAHLTPANDSDQVSKLKKELEELRRIETERTLQLEECLLDVRKDSLQDLDHLSAASLVSQHQVSEPKQQQENHMPAYVSQADAEFLEQRRSQRELEKRKRLTQQTQEQTVTPTQSQQLTPPAPLPPQGQKGASALDRMKAL